MKRWHLSILACPTCRAELSLTEDVGDGTEVQGGTLRCLNCQIEYPIIAGIPRFVPAEDYTAGFSFQWMQHAQTQHDRFSGVPISRERFFNETQWPSRLEGEAILEIGCGAGRFTSPALSTGATVVSVDMSRAVDVNYRLHRDEKNLLVVQADLRNLPLRLHGFDRLFCLGVLQHTPDVEQAFKSLPSYLKSGGQLTIDVYDRREDWSRWVERLYRTYYWLRPLTRRLPSPLLYACVTAYIHLVWPLTSRIARAPRLGRALNRILLVHDYRQRYDLTEAQLKQWAILDTFDNLAPRYDQRQSLSTVQRWFAECDVTDIDVHYGYNGIEGRATKC